MNKEQFKVWTEFGAAYEISETVVSDGVKCWKFDFSYPEDLGQTDRVINIEFSFPITDVTGNWTPVVGTKRQVVADWDNPRTSMTSRYAPVFCLFNGEGANRGTLAWSEIDQKVEMQYGVHEEDGTMLCTTRIHLTRGSFVNGYQTVLREDFSGNQYWDALQDVVSWWEEVKNLTYLKAPLAARKPLYSFWYSFHQDVNEKNVEDECRLAAENGYTAVIVDDGWQTADNNRGYAFCGDWEMEPTKFPDFAAHVKRVQDMGLKYMLWFSVPFIGVHTKIWEKFQDKMLYMTGKWGVLDIRYPECRKHLLDIYKKAVLEWNLDGLKLDFIDCFVMKPESPAWKEGMDFADVQEALNALLAEINICLRAAKPELLIEFRQAYIGPRVQCYGNMLRVADCPMSAVLNRVGIADLRMLSKSVAVHSDMLMWHADEKTEDAALQILNCLFGVLQFSVKLDTMSADVKKMVSFWIKFMEEHMDLLQNSRIRPLEPENLYPEISVNYGSEALTAHYSKGRMVSLDSAYETFYFVNAVKAQSVVLQGCDAEYSYEITDCMGNVCGSGVAGKDCLCKVEVPAAGMVTFRKATV